MGGRGSPSGVGEETAAPDGAGSPARMLYILELFSATEPVWSTAAIIEALETSRSTGYRYIKTLHDAGLLTAVRNGYYGLGPRIIEMDLQCAKRTHCSWPAMAYSRTWWTRSGTPLFCVLRMRLGLVHRGVPRPTESGQPVQPRAAPPLVSRSGLEGHPGPSPPSPPESHLPSPVQGNGDRRAGQHVEHFSGRPGQIKKDGYLVTMGEFTPGVYGVAAPVLNDQKTSLGSVGVAWDENARRDVEVEQAVLAVKRAATTISERLMEKQRRT